jgi:hypothetical protein
MPEFALFVTYADVFGREITEDDLITRIETLSLNDCLQSLGKLSTLISDAQDNRREVLGFMFQGLRSPGAVMLLDGMVRYGGRVLVWDRQLMAVARLALLHAQDRPPDSFNDGADRWRFVETLLGVNDVYAHEGTDVETVRDGIEAEEWMASFRLRRVGMPKRIARQGIVRAVRVFIDLPQQHPELVTTVAPAASFEERIRMPLERYLAICFGAMTRFSTWDRSPDGWLLGSSYWVNSSVTEEEATRALSTLSATTAQLRHSFGALVQRGQNSIDDNRPFLLHPLIELEPAVYSPIDVEGLADAMIGDGLFWRMRPNDEQGAQRFGETLGHLLERHCLDVAESVYPVEQRPKRLFPEFRYRAGDGTRIHGPDLIVADPRASAFIEIGVGRPHLRNTVLRGDLVSYDDDVQRLILHRAEQLDRKINDALAGHLILQDAPPDCLRRVYPVVCLWDGFPLGRYLYQRIERVIRDAGLLQQAEATPICIISVQDLEQLLGRVNAGDLLTDIFHRHVSSQLAEEPMNDFLHGTYGRVIELPPALSADFDAIAHRLAAQLFPPDA